MVSHRSRSAACRIAVAMAIAGSLCLTGCKEKMVYEVGGADLPNFSDTQPTTSSLAVPGGAQEAIVFRPATPTLLEKYVNWLLENGWKKLSETQEVTQVIVIMTKGQQQLTLTFSAGAGLIISGVHQGASADAATTSSIAGPGTN